MAEQVEPLHLLLAVAPDGIVVGKVLDQLPNARAKLVCEVRRRGTDERVDVVARDLRHAAKPNAPLGSRAVLRRRTAELMLLATVVLWALNFTVTKYALSTASSLSRTRPFATAPRSSIFTSFTYGTERTFSVRRRDVGLLVLAAASGSGSTRSRTSTPCRTTNASTVALILGATPIFAALIAFVDRARTPARPLLDRGGGLVRRCRVDRAREVGRRLSASLKGDALGVATAATWAAYTVAIAPLMQRYSPYRISAVVLAIGWIRIAIRVRPRRRPVVRPRGARLGRSRLRDPRAARADQYPLFHGRRPRRAVERVARREPPAVRRRVFALVLLRRRSRRFRSSAAC